MKHIKNINEFFWFGPNGSNLPNEDTAKIWWEGLQPDDQQSLADKYYPDNDFGALAISPEEISFMYKLEYPKNEGSTFKGNKKKFPTKEWDPDKKSDFRKKIYDHVKSLSGKTTQIGNDYEVLCNDKMVAQVMFRNDYVGVRPTGAKFTTEFKYSELGKIKSSITDILKKCK